MKNPLFITMRLERFVDIELLGQKTDLPLSWADGMVGAIPVFNSVEAAQTYDPDAEIIPMKVNKLDNNQEITQCKS